MAPEATKKESKRVVVISKDGAGRWPMDREEFTDEKYLACFLKNNKLTMADIRVTDLPD